MRKNIHITNKEELLRIMADLLLSGAFVFYGESQAEKTGNIFID